MNLAVAGPLRVATVGLGTGTIAVYGREGDYYCFYEINPGRRADLAQYFTFLSDCPAAVEVKLGDVRLSMEQLEEPQAYDVIALDAFSGDAIPAHLLTVEAFAVYLRHLNRRGVIVVHTSNRHLDLPPIVALLASTTSMQAVSLRGGDAEGVADSASEWLLVTNNPGSCRAMPCGRFDDAGTARPVDSRLDGPVQQLVPAADVHGDPWRIAEQAGSEVDK